MHKQHPQTAYRKDAVLIGTIFENCDKRRGYGSQQTDLSELRTQNETAVHSEKRDFKISDVLITAWSRVQILPGPPSPHEKRHLAMRCLFSSSEHPSRSHGNAAQGRCRSTKLPMSAKTSARFVSTRSSCRAPG